MIKNQLKAINAKIESLSQLVMNPPRSIRVKEFFPTENAVTIQLMGAGSEFGGRTPKGVSGDHKFPLGYRGDVSVSMAPQPGDIGLLFYTGFQYKTGFVFLSHTPGGENATTYTPVRGSWAL
jgi:hypothetical protein